MAPEALPLDDLLTSITRSFVSAKEELDRVQTILEREPENQTRLSSARFDMSDVEVEVSYVVADAQPATNPSVTPVMPDPAIQLSVREVRSLKRGADPAAPLLDRLLGDYAEARGELERLARLGEVKAEEVVIHRTPRITVPEEVRSLLETGASRRSVAHLRQLLDDYGATKNELDRLSQATRPSRPPLSVQVRLDPEALSESPVQQKVKFRLLAKTTENVVVDDGPDSSQR